MSNVSSVLEGLDDNQAFYDPSSDTAAPKKLIEEGTYNAVVYSLTIKRDITVKGKYLSDIFEAIYKLDDDRYPDLKGREVKSKGYFRFKTPDKKKYPNLNDNQGQNKGYMIFAEACGFSMEKNEQGKYVLPMLMEGDIAGNPVNIKVVHDKWTDNSGEERVTPLAINVFKSDKQSTLKEDDLPF